VELLGHSTIILTANTYASVPARLTRQAANSMDDLLALGD
jgi:hypothetical protein